MARHAHEKLGYTPLRILARVIHRAPWLFVIPAIAAAVWGLHLTLHRLGYLSNTNDLIRPDAEFHRHHLEYLKEFRTADDFVVLISGPDPERNRACLADLASRFERAGETTATDGRSTFTRAFPRVFWRIDFSRLERRFLLLMPMEELREMERRIGEFVGMLASPGGARTSIDLNSLLSRANAMFQEDFLREEKNWDTFKPFVTQFASGLETLADQLEGRRSKRKLESIDGLLTGGGSAAELERLKTENEYLSFDGGKKYLLLLGPGEPDPASLTPFGPKVKLAREILAAARADYPDLRIGLTGESVLDTDQVETSISSVSVATVVTLVLISLLFVLSYRELLRPFLALATLIMAVLWSLGFATLAVGHLNIISNAFVAMILGLGIDFGIQLLGRYEEEISRGTPVGDALEESIAHTGNAILTGAATTAAAFYTMCFNDFRGLAELGLIAGTGILLCLAGNLLVFPSLIAILDRRRKNLARTASATHWRAGLFLKEPFPRHPFVIPLLALAVTVTAVWSARSVRFDHNLLNLQNPKLDSVQVERELLSGETRSAIYAVLIADSIEEARAKAERARALPTVQSVATLGDLLPEGQEEKLAIVRRIVDRLQSLSVETDVSEKIDVRRARRELAAFLDNSRAAAAQARKYDRVSKRAREAEQTFLNLIPSLERGLKAIQTRSQADVGRILNAYQLATFGELQKALKWLSSQETDRPIDRSDVPPQLEQRYVGRTGKILVEVYPKENVWDRAPLTRFVGELRSIDPGVTGSPVQYFEYLEILRRAFAQAGLYALCVICITLFLHYSRPGRLALSIPLLALGLGWHLIPGAPAGSAVDIARVALVALALLCNVGGVGLVLLTLSPLALAVVWTVGLMPAIGLAFTPANLITLPLLIGIGVAYGVYAVDRHREGTAVSLFDTSTAKAVWLSAFTTLFGFAPLGLASYRGISGLGLLMAIGVSMALFTSLYVLPHVLRITCPVRRRAAPDPAGPPEEAPRDGTPR